MGSLEKNILDACCGSKMMWYQKDHPNVLFADIRQEEHTLCDGRALEVKPDVIADFRDLPFEDSTFKLVVFDPPHLKHLGQSSYMAKKYGVLGFDWRTDIQEGFKECFRVLQPDGILIFKWNTQQIKESDVLALTDQKPLFGHRAGKGRGTIWFCFMKK